MIYVMHSERQQALKIGIAKDIDQRLMTLRTSCPDWEVLRHLSLKSAMIERRIEQRLHKQFRHENIERELFHYSIGLLQEIDRIFANYQ